MVHEVACASQQRTKANGFRVTRHRRRTDVWTAFGPLIQWRAKWSDEQIAFNPGQRRAMTLIGAAPHAAQIAEGPCAGGDKTMVKPVDAATAVVFSYRFQARLEPKWHAIIEKVFGLATEKEQLTLGAKLSENPHEDRIDWPEV
jgi:hypothetical protein